MRIRLLLVLPVCVLICSCSKFGFADPHSEELVLKINESFKTKDYEELHHFARMLRNRAKLSSDHRYLALSHHFVAKAFYKTKILDSSFYNYERAARAYRAEGLDRGLAVCYIETSRLLNQIEDQAAAERLAMKAIEFIDDEVESNVLKSHAYTVLSEIYIALGEYRQAREFERTVFDLLRTEPAGNERFVNSFNLGVAAIRLNQLGEARYWFFQALKYLDFASEDGYQARRLYNQMAAYFRLVDQYDHAERFSRTALTTLKGATPEDSIRTYIGYALSMNSLPRSVPILLRSEQIARRYDLRFERREIIGAYVEIGHPKSNLFADNYMKISDTLERNERRIQNRYGKIRFRHSELEGEKEMATIERVYYSIIGLGLLVIITLLFLIRAERIKRNELAVLREQHVVNMRIHKILDRKDAEIDAERKSEKSRIAAEIKNSLITKLNKVKSGLLEPVPVLDASGELPEVKKIHQVEFDVRRLAHALNSEIFSGNISFNTSLTEMFDGFAEISNASFFLEVSPVVRWEDVPVSIRINLYKIISDILEKQISTGPRNIFITVVTIGPMLRIIFIDDGDGTDLLMKKRGEFVKGLQRRLKLLDATLDNKLRPGKGATIIVTLPHRKQNYQHAEESQHYYCR